MSWTAVEVRVAVEVKKMNILTLIWKRSPSIRTGSKARAEKTGVRVRHASALNVRPVPQGHALCWAARTADRTLIMGVLVGALLVRLFKIVAVWKIGPTQTVALIRLPTLLAIGLKTAMAKKSVQRWRRARLKFWT